MQAFILLSKLLLNTPATLDSRGGLAPLLLPLVRHTVAPALVWRAGRTHSAVRTAAASSLWSAVLAAAAHPPVLQQIFPEVRPHSSPV